MKLHFWVIFLDVTQFTVTKSVVHLPCICRQQQFLLLDVPGDTTTLPTTNRITRRNEIQRIFYVLVVHGAWYCQGNRYSIPTNK